MAFGAGELPGAGAHLGHQVHLQLHVAVRPLEEVVCAFTPQAFGLEGEGAFQFLQLQGISQLQCQPSLQQQRRLLALGCAVGK